MSRSQPRSRAPPQPAQLAPVAPPPLGLPPPLRRRLHPEAGSRPSPQKVDVEEFPWRIPAIHLRTDRHHSTAMNRSVLWRPPVSKRSDCTRSRIATKGEIWWRCPRRGSRGGRGRRPWCRGARWPTNWRLGLGTSYPSLSYTILFSPSTIYILLLILPRPSIFSRIFSNIENSFNTRQVGGGQKSL